MYLLNATWTFYMRRQIMSSAEKCISNCVSVVSKENISCWICWNITLDEIKLMHEWNNNWVWCNNCSHYHVHRALSVMLSTKYFSSSCRCVCVVYFWCTVYIQELAGRYSSVPCGRTDFVYIATSGIARSYFKKASKFYSTN